MAEIYSFTDIVAQSYTVWFLAQFFDDGDDRQTIAFYGEASSGEETGSLARPTEEAMTIWLREFMQFNPATARELLVKLNNGETVALPGRFTREELAKAGFAFRKAL